MHAYIQTDRLIQENKKLAKRHVIGLFSIPVKSTFPHLIPELFRKSSSIRTSANLTEITSLFSPECLTFTRNNEAEQSQMALAGTQQVTQLTSSFVGAPPKSEKSLTPQNYQTPLEGLIWWLTKAIQQLTL